tara:strand:- start:2353 stop:3234 length:882 start_codon:yes stop_codon:yes gene_type:complete
MDPLKYTPEVRAQFRRSLWRAFFKHPFFVLKYGHATLPRVFYGKIIKLAVGSLELPFDVQPSSNSISRQKRIIAHGKFGITGFYSYLVLPYETVNLTKVVSKLNKFALDDCYLTVIYADEFVGLASQGWDSLYVNSREWSKINPFYQQIINKIDSGDWEWFASNDNDMLHAVYELLDQHLLTLKDTALSKLNLHHLLWLCIEDEQIGFKTATETCTSRKDFELRYKRDIQSNVFTEILRNYVFRGGRCTSNFNILEDINLLTNKNEKLSQDECWRLHVLKNDPVLTDVILACK